MYLIFQRIQARRCLYWAIAIMVIIGIADCNSLKTSPDDLRDHATVRADYGYYYISAEAIEKKCLGRTFEAIDGHYRLATEVVNKEDGRMEAKYDMIAALRQDGAFYQTQLGFNADGICDQVTFGKQIKDTNSFLLKRLSGVQTIMGWDWLTWHVQEGLYVFGYNGSDNAWYTNILLGLGYLFAVTVWAMAPPFLPVLLLLFCLVFSFTRYIKKLIKILIPIFLIGSAYIWMVAMLCWGYPWLIGLPLGFCVIMIGMGNLMSIVDDEGPNTYLRKPDSEVLELIKPYIVNELGLDEREVTPQARLEDDLGFDELDYLEVFMAIEEGLDIAIPTQKFILNRIKTIDDLVHVIKKYN